MSSLSRLSVGKAGFQPGPRTPTGNTARIYFRCLRKMISLSLPVSVADELKKAGQLPYDVISNGRGGRPRLPLENKVS
jgi:hypothetical protein